MFLQTHLHVSGVGIATRDDVARGAVYEAAVIAELPEHAGGAVGMLFRF